jgi:hypothetical protein
MSRVLLVLPHPMDFRWRKNTSKQNHSLYATAPPHTHNTPNNSNSNNLSPELLLKRTRLDDDEPLQHHLTVETPRWWHSMNAKHDARECVGGFAAARTHTHTFSGTFLYMWHYFYIHELRLFTRATAIHSLFIIIQATRHVL